MYIKVIGLLAVVAAALTAFAGTASADTLIGPNNETTPTIHAVSEGHVKLANSIANVECPSTAAGVVTQHPFGGSVQGTFSVLTFGHGHVPGTIFNPTIPANPCTNSWHVTVVSSGTFSIETAGSGSGLVKSSGATIETTRFGVTCNYSTSETVIGTFTDATTAANKLGTLDVSASIPLHTGSSFLCGTGWVKWEGSYSSTTRLFLANS